MRWWKSAVNRSFSVALRLSVRAPAPVTRFPGSAPAHRCWLAFSLASVLRSVASAAGRPVLFGDFPATMTESNFSPPCIIGFGSSFPMRASRLYGLWPDARSLRFRRIPFRRDVVFDPGGVTAPRMTVPRMLPSMLMTGSASHGETSQFFNSLLGEGLPPLLLMSTFPITQSHAR